MTVNTTQSRPFYRFEIFKGVCDSNGEIQKARTMGYAYLPEGFKTHTIKLWSLPDTRYYLLQNPIDQGRYSIMSRELNQVPGSQRKYFWNKIGDATVFSKLGVVKLSFDLFADDVYMSLYPMASTQGMQVPDLNFQESESQAA